MQVQINNQALELRQGDITLQEVGVLWSMPPIALGGRRRCRRRKSIAAVALDHDRDRGKVSRRLPHRLGGHQRRGHLPARYVLHAVGPIWNGGRRGEAELLASAYHRCLELAVQNGCHSIAFPSLSTGLLRYPVDQAARVALRTIIDFLNEQGQPRLVRLVLFDAGTYGAMRQRWKRSPETRRTLLLATRHSPLASSLVEPRVSQAVDDHVGNAEILGVAMLARHGYREGSGRGRRTTAVLTILQHQDFAGHEAEAGPLSGRSPVPACREPRRPR